MKPAAKRIKNITQAGLSMCQKKRWNCVRWVFSEIRITARMAMMIATITRGDKRFLMRSKVLSELWFHVGHGVPFHARTAATGEA